MSAWVDILTKGEIADRDVVTSKLDPSFAAQSKAFWASRTVSQLQSLAVQAWNCNDAEQYQMARSYSAIAKAEGRS